MCFSIGSKTNRCLAGITVVPALLLSSACGTEVQPPAGSMTRHEVWRIPLDGTAGGLSSVSSAAFVGHDRVLVLDPQTLRAYIAGVNDRQVRGFTVPRLDDGSWPGIVTVTDDTVLLASPVSSACRRYVLRPGSIRPALDRMSSEAECSLGAGIPGRRTQIAALGGPALTFQSAGSPGV